MRYWPDTRDKSHPCKGFACRSGGHRVRGGGSSYGLGHRRRRAGWRAGGLRSDAGLRIRRLCSSGHGIPLTVISTRWGRRRKERLGVAERRRGRNASQIVANLGVAMLCALPVIWFPDLSELLLVGAMAALAEAAADTVSSELGQATGRGAYMITDFREAPIGTNGAISVEGTLAGCVAACIVSWVSASSGLVDWHWTPVIALAGNQRHVPRQHHGRNLGKCWEDGQ